MDPEVNKLSVMEQPKANPESSTGPAADPADRVALRVVDASGGEVFFKIREGTTFARLFKAYCEKKGVAPNSVRFLYDGKRLNEEQTPKSVGMQNDDVIDALVQQTGGK